MRFFLVLLCFTILTGCGSSNNTPNTTAANSNIPPEILAEMPPDPGSSANATLAGIDANSNLIRDDLEIWIMQNYYSDPNTMNAALAFSQSMQGHFYFPETQEEVERVRDMNLYDIGCLARLNPDHWLEITREVERRQYNTNDREAEHQRIGKMMSGKLSAPISNSVPTSAYCRFEIK